jgi:hypothetical protein
MLNGWAQNQSLTENTSTPTGSRRRRPIG